MSEGPPLEVIGQGREPVDPRRQRRPIPRGLRVTGSVVLAVLSVGAVYLTARPHQQPGGVRVPLAAASASPVPSTIVVEPAPADLSALPERQQIVVSTADGDHTFIAFGGHILLFLRVTYVGPASVRVVDGRVPQAGAYPDAGAGGLTAGTTANVALRKGVPTELFVRTRVECHTVLAGPAVGHLDVVTQQDRAAPSSQRIDLTGIDGFWDEARHAACRPKDAAHDVSVAVGGLQASPAIGGHPPWVEGVITLHNAAGFDAVVTLQDPSWSVLSRTAAAMTSAGAVVQGGSTYTTPVRWTVTDCAAATQEPAPALPVQVVIGDSTATLPGVLGQDFATAFRLTLLTACR